MKQPTSVTFWCTGILGLALLLSAPLRSRSGGAEDLAQPAKADGPALGDSQTSTNAPGPVRLDQEAIDQLRREIEQSAARNAEAIAAGLSLIEPELARMHERQMEAVQSSNRTLLIVAGIFGAVGFLGLILVSLILVRAIGRFSELAVMAGPRGQILGSGHALAVLGTGEMTAARASAAEQASGRFQGAIEQLHKRIGELEHSVQAAGAETLGSHPGEGPQAAGPTANVEPLTSALNIQPLLPTSTSPSSPPAEGAAAAPRATLLLGKGQALLNLDSAEQALRCFEEVLSLEPNNPEALIKKGMALEKLQDWEQALESYDRAIAADSSLTVAYLYRGGVCNRLQRYREALESYEQALRTEKKSRAS